MVKVKNNGYGNDQMTGEICTNTLFDIGRSKQSRLHETESESGLA